MKVPNTSIVFAAQPGNVTLHRSMFDERSLFGGEDFRARSVMGPIAEFSYDDGQYEFAIVPDRVMLGHIGNDLLPDRLVEAASVAIASLERQESTGIIASIGFNMERVISAHSEEFDGNAFCSALVHHDTVSVLVGSTGHQPLLRTVFQVARFQYDLRIEPHAETHGRGLFLALNVSQSNAPSEDLRERTLEPVQVIRSYMDGLLQRIETLMQGGSQ